MQINQQATPLSGWATITEVSEMLGVQYNTIKQTVRKAHAFQQDWVKLVPYPTPDCQKRWLLNTNHHIYHYHEKRWRRLAQKSGSAQANLSTTHAVSGKEHQEVLAVSSCNTADMQGQAIDIRKTWPELCHWLAESGLVVFVNAIATDQRWQWYWMGKTGTGYPNAKAALTAALQYQFIQGGFLFPSTEG
jgi:hypothetical protein